MKEKVATIGSGLLICIALAIPCWFLGILFPVVGGAVFSILIGMVIAIVWEQCCRGVCLKGVDCTSKKILQLAVIVLGFGLNLLEVIQVGALSLPIICSTIATALIVSYILYKVMKMPSKISTLIGVGSSICGGSAIAATAPVIKANDEEIAQSISVIFLFNILAALIFPTLGNALGLTTEGFGLFAGTAVNDTSSVTAAATAWDGLHPGANALAYATIVKLTRTLAIIPITLVLAFWMVRKEKKAAAQMKSERLALLESEGADIEEEEEVIHSTFSLKRAFPMFILFFLLASIITTVCISLGVPSSAFSPLKTLAKFLIITAMGAIGFNTDIVKLVKTGGKPLLMGLVCWVCITVVSLLMQKWLGLW
ncbi:MAG: YeiH family protein [Eggerthellaceae bacterium]|nr:YeiH family protein [Eggerthellaceae bacterium]